MRRITSILTSQKILTAFFIVFSVTFCALIVSNLLKNPFIVANNDNYKDLFASFILNGYYESVAKGTTILYAVFLSVLYRFTADIDASFLILNAASLLFVAVFGSYMIVKIAGKGRLSMIIVGMYVLQIVETRTFLMASNDTFLGVFVLLFLYFLIAKISSGKALHFACCGLFLGLCFCIRSSAVLLLPLLLIGLYFWIQSTSVALWVRSRLVALLLICAIGPILAFHYPSIREHQTLSYEDKNPETGVNWVQRNYLGLKKIENGHEAMHRDAIWKNTKFEEVSAYVNQHGPESLPNSYSKVLLTDPMLVLKIALHNIYSVILWMFRFWGFLFILPIVAVFTRKMPTVDKLPILLLACFTFCISAVCFTFIEFRWFGGFLTLLPLSILLAFKNRVLPNVKWENMIVLISLVMVTLLNFRTLIK